MIVLASSRPTLGRRAPKAASAADRRRANESRMAPAGADTRLRGRSRLGERASRNQQRRNGVWWVQLRRPPVYCFKGDRGSRTETRPTSQAPDASNEVRCPARPMRGCESDPPGRAPPAPARRPRKHGSVTLTAVGPEQRECSSWPTEISVPFGRTYCGEAYQRCPSTLSDSLPRRSTTLVRLSLRSPDNDAGLVDLDSGGAHGGTPIGCAELTPSLDVSRRRPRPQRVFTRSAAPPA